MTVRRATVGGLALGLVGLSLALGEAASAAYPGVNGEIAFTSTQDGGARHIFVATQTGTTDLTGATSPAIETQPKFSPDGREIAFTRAGPGLPNPEIFVMSATGAQRTQLTNTPQGNSDPTWSPDGTQIAFVSERDNEVPNIFIMRSDGTGVRQITNDSSGKSELAWSPRGDRIVFVRVPAGGGDREIYAVTSNGSGLTDLSNDPTNYDIEPAFSPDGSRIVYSGPGRRGESVGMDLWTMNADGSGQQPLHHESNGYSDGAYPAWSPDGSTITFSANNGSGYYHLWSVPASGGENTERVTNKIPGGNPGDEEADWQPLTTQAPTTKITRVKVGRRAATIAFAATGPATGFRCALRRGARRARLISCGSPKTYKRLRAGRYTFEVSASGPGEPYRGIAKRRFTIR
jgi:Tol biopolymer transport system component